MSSDDDQNDGVETRQPGVQSDQRGRQEKETEAAIFRWVFVAKIYEFLETTSF